MQSSNTAYSVHYDTSILILYNCLVVCIILTAVCFAINILSYLICCDVVERMRDKANSRERYGSTSKATDSDIRRPAVPTLSDWCLRRIIQVLLLLLAMKYITIVSVF